MRHTTHRTLHRFQSTSTIPGRRQHPSPPSDKSPLRVKEQQFAPGTCVVESSGGWMVPPGRSQLPVCSLALSSPSLCCLHRRAIDGFILFSRFLRLLRCILASRYEFVSLFSVLVLSAHLFVLVAFSSGRWLCPQASPNGL